MLRRRAWRFVVPFALVAALFGCESAFRAWASKRTAAAGPQDGGGSGRRRGGATSRAAVRIVRAHHAPRAAQPRINRARRRLGLLDPGAGVGHEPRQGVDRRPSAPPAGAVPAASGDRLGAQRRQDVALAERRVAGDAGRLTLLADRGGAGALTAGTTIEPPDELASRILTLRDSSTRVLLRPTHVAGRAAYRVSLAPGRPGSLVDRVVIAVDARSGLPLRVSVYARNHATPVIDDGFSDLSYSPPSSESLSSARRRQRPS